MNKELKALETFSNIKETYGHFKVFDKPIREVQEDFHVIKQALTPPTQEVCEALSEYLDEKVWYENGCFYVGTHNEYEAVVYLFDDDIHFNVVLSPKIVILIGRFYERMIGE